MEKVLVLVLSRESKSPRGEEFIFLKDYLSMTTSFVEFYILSPPWILDFSLVPNALILRGSIVRLGMFGLLPLKLFPP
jgi:hypothetical protein